MLGSLLHGYHVHVRVYVCVVNINIIIICYNHWGGQEACLSDQFAHHPLSTPGQPMIILYT